MIDTTRIRWLLSWCVCRRSPWNPSLEPRPSKRRLQRNHQMMRRRMRRSQRKRVAARGRGIPLTSLNQKKVCWLNWTADTRWYSVVRNWTYIATPYICINVQWLNCISSVPTYVHVHVYHRVWRVLSVCVSYYMHGAWLLPDCCFLTEAIVEPEAPPLAQRETTPPLVESEPTTTTLLEERQPEGVYTVM